MCVVLHGASRGRKKFLIKVTFLSASNRQIGDKVILGMVQRHTEKRHKELVFSISNRGMKREGMVPLVFQFYGPMPPLHRNY